MNANKQSVYTDSKPTGDAERGKVLHGISPKAMIVTLVYLFALGYVINKGEVAHMGPMFMNVWMPSVPGLGLVLVLYAAGPFLRKVRLEFSHAELISIYCMVMLASMVMSLGWFGYFINSIAAMGDLEMRNPGMFQPFIEKISTLLRPSQAEIQKFWIGDASVNWGEWIAPMISWSLLFGAIVFCYICLATVFRYNWMERQKLTYPLTVPIISFTREGGTGIGEKSSLWRHPLAYLGFIPAIIYKVPDIIHRYWPGFPSSPTSMSLKPFFQGTFLAPMAGTHPEMVVTWWPMLIGVGYLVPLNLSFSVGFFYLCQRFGFVLLDVFSLNIGPRNWLSGYVYNQYLGASLGLLVISVYLARDEFKRVFAKALSREGSDAIDDSNEPLSFKMAFWGGIAAIAFIVLFMWVLAGVSPWITIVYLTIFFAISLAFMRARVEVGIPMTRPGAVFISNFIKDYVGLANVGLNSAAGLGYFHVLEYGAFGANAGSIAEAYKFADEARIRRRSMTTMLLVAFFVAAITAFVTGLPLFLKLGMYNLDTERQWNPVNAFRWIRQLSRGVISAESFPNGFINPSIGFVIYGFAVTYFLSFMTAQYVWWPFHPIGYYLGVNYHIVWMVWGFIIAWFLKALILRYGGYPLYRKLLPVFLGMIVGSVLLEILDSGLVLIFG